MQYDLTTAAGQSLEGAVTDYFGFWLIYEPAFRSLVERHRGLNLHAHINSAEARQAVAQQMDRDCDVTQDGIAIIPINGPMMKRASSLSGGTSTTALRQQFRSAKRDPNVRGVMLTMDTPGGTVAGNSDCCDDLAALAAAKPVYAFAEDLCASGGVSVASQATKRFANNATALYGSMGTYATLTDQSGMADKLGVKVHVIRAGEHKGAGTPGTAITESHLAEAQRIVDSLNEGYLNLIARGLGQPLARIKSMADGRIHTAADAAKMGLIDGVQSYEKTYTDLVAVIGGHRPSAARQSPPRSSYAAVPALSAAQQRAQIVASFDGHVRQCMAKGLSRRDACASVQRRMPLLHEQYLGVLNRRSRPY